MEIRENTDRLQLKRKVLETKGQETGLKREREREGERGRLVL